jgi:F-type H+-transporting ATPase subunit delta
VNALAALTESSPEFVAFLRNPLLPPGKQAEVAEALFGGRLNELTMKFVQLLIHQSRLDMLPEILEELSAALDGEREILEVSLRTAEKFTAAQEKALTEKLSARTGKSVRLVEEVDPGLIGGFLFRIGDAIEDYSLLAKLNRFKQNIINA